MAGFRELSLCPSLSRLIRRKPRREWLQRRMLQRRQRIQLASPPPRQARRSYFDMSQFDSNWLRSYESRNAPAIRREGHATPPDGVSREIAGLHGPIIEECKRRGWKYIHSDPSRPTTCGEGVCDFVIYAHSVRWMCPKCFYVSKAPVGCLPDCETLLPVPRMFHIECKTVKGKLTIDQLAFIHWITKLGHTAHVITGMSEFFAIIDEK